MLCRAFLVVLSLATIASSQQTVAPSFLNADFNKYTSLPGYDGVAKPANLFGVRLWDGGVKWSQVETSRGVYNWTLFDAWVTTAQADGRDVLYTFGGTPEWAVNGPPPAKCNPPSPWACAVPSNMSDFTDYVTAVVKRYKGRIAFYELWNEPDCPCYWAGTAAQLETMTASAASVIRSQDRAARILSPSAHGPTMATWFHAYIAAGGAANFDIVNVHMRGQGNANATPEAFLSSTWPQVQTELIRDQLTDRPVWDDEHGILSTNGVNDADMLASFVARELLVRASVPLARQYVYLWDSPAPTYGEEGNASGTAWNVVGSWLSGQTTTAARITGMIYSIRVGKGTVAWDSSQTCASGKCTTSSYVPGPMFKTATDITGKTTKLVGRTYPLGVKPVYFQ